MSYLRLDEEQESDILEINVTILEQRPVTILVVDDHALVRSAIGQALTPQPGVKLVVMARNYAEAEASAKNLRPEIICLDMQIAHCDSIAEIHRLRKLSSDSRILSLTDVEDEQEARATAARRMRFVLKSVTVMPGDISMRSEFEVYMSAPSRVHAYL